MRTAEEQADGGGRHWHVLHGELCGAQVRRALGHAGLHRQAAVPRCGPRTSNDLPRRPAQATCPGDLLSEQAPYYGALTSSARFAELVFVKPCFEKYSRASTAARVVFAAFDPDYEACSLDEACLDITDYCAAHGVSGACRRDVAISRSLTLKAAEPPRHRRSDGKLIPKARPSRRWASGTGCSVMTRMRLWH